ncbi:hypothetical protein Pint_36416 [Pistacia integerrima]|uniref:Uncharacterized protein n=1 Tax=Pistacia integerrima TaxID=434235 RepID=A0ACC0Y420_9ROSI|nr:hypothetical protein Pint_36416 [Pistacia integerrima]
MFFTRRAYASMFDLLVFFISISAISCSPYLFMFD